MAANGRGEDEEYRAREKHHRLARHLYRGRVAVAFTMCLRDGKKAFTDVAVVARLKDMLGEELSRFGCSAVVYCFMPDHLHVLVKGKEPEADVLGAIVAFKQRSGYWLRRQGRKVRWQKDFYDHVLREEEDMADVAKYIAHNPVRAGLCETAEEYAFTGSIPFIGKQE
ncbi:MAG: transposase [Armatimonadetes bacterium]|nr:transposase [Armatimonadota bacterium]